eukprot:COSAG04_NODE_24316_length_323_cov_1.361607_1_plen_95_part_10
MHTDLEGLVAISVPERLRAAVGRETVLIGSATNRRAHHACSMHVSRFAQHHGLEGRDSPLLYEFETATKVSEDRQRATLAGEAQWKADKGAQQAA